MNLEIAVETIGPWKVVNLRGRIDASSTETFDSSLKKLIASGASRVLINCAELRYVGSVGIGILVECSKSLSASGGYLSFSGMNPHIRSVFEMVGIVGLFPIYSSVEEALKS
jgi:anti-sigma B factor antagonist